MRHFKRVATSLGLAVALAACGGGSGQDTSAGALFTKTDGNITALNGQSANVAGVQVQAPVASKSSVSDTSGRFDLGDLPAEPVEIVITVGGSSASITVDLSGGGRATIHLSIEDGNVVRMSMEHCDGDGGENETRVALTPLQAGLKGKIEIEAKARGDQKLELEAEHLTPGQTVEFLITNDSNATENLGTFTANAFGEVELEIETENGAMLPFAATSVRDLEGFAVTVRDATTGDDLLEGSVPVLGEVPTDCGAEDDDDGDDDDDRREGESRLTNASGVTGEAEVELESRPDRGEEEFEVKVELTNVTGGMEVWLEDPSNAGTLVMIGTMALDDDGDWKLEFETDDGDTLPFGAAGVSELVGLAIEIRRVSDGSVAYSGTTPPIRAS